MPAPALADRLHAMTEPTGTAGAPRRVLIVDADRRVRHSLTGLIGIGEGLDVFASGATGAAALDMVEALQPDVVLVDVRGTARDPGLELIAALHRQAHHPNLVAMSTCEDLEGFARASGAAAFVVKDGQPVDFMRAVMALPPTVGEIADG